MTTPTPRGGVDAFAISWTRAVMARPLLTLLIALITTFACAYGAKNLTFASNYRVFFSKQNPELAAFEAFQATYTKSDNILFVLKPRSGAVFEEDTLTAVETITEAGWRTPFVIRVDSITNFQHTYAIGDELIVEDLVADPGALSAEEFAEKRAVALAEPLLNGQLLNADASATAVNVVLQYPFESVSEVPEAVTYARNLADEIRAAHPDIEVVLTGISMLNNAFVETGNADMAGLIPLMFLLILGLTALIVRSVSGTAATLFVIVFSMAAAMGLAGWAGVELTPISAAAPVVILTLAVADSIHILLSMRAARAEGMAKRDAIVEAMRVNFLAVTITSLTTVVGFLALNYSDAPPFRHLGNISAAGITAAWLFSITVLPALCALLPSGQTKKRGDGFLTRGLRAVANIVIARRRAVALLSGAGAIALTAMIPTIEFNDQWVEYFDESVEFRRHADVASQDFGLYPIEYSVPAGEPGGVSEPDFLEKLDAFADFLKEQPGVAHVYSLADIMKRLNKNLHADDPSYYRLPDDRELSAQYLLLYELSLPYGLDLNDRINIDKSATRVTVTLDSISTKEAKALLRRGEDWLRTNAPEILTDPTGPQVMFTYVTDRNIQGMIVGTTIAVIAISAIMIAALRSISLGVLSLIPNALPILSAFGAWAVLVGEVGFSIASVASISLGIVVDDTVHFLTKYVRARRERGLTAEESVRYAFENVGLAITANTVILTAGFLILTASAFKINADMGLLTALAIVFALILDFLFLPAILLWIGGERARPNAPTVKGDAAHAPA